jgi:hypothetical protein
MIIPPICHTYLSSWAGATGPSEATVPTVSLSPHSYNYQRTFTSPNIPVSFVDCQICRMLNGSAFSVKYRSTFIIRASYLFTHLIRACVIQHVTHCLIFVNLIPIPHTYTPPNTHCPRSRPEIAATAIKDISITSNSIYIRQAVTNK